MCKAPNKSKITTFLRKCLTSTSAKADLSALYSLDNFKFLRIVKKYGGDKYVKSYTLR